MFVNQVNRRDFTRLAALAPLLSNLSSFGDDLQFVAETPTDDAVEVVLPRNRVPLSFIIDDSTCLLGRTEKSTKSHGENGRGKFRIGLFVTLVNGAARRGFVESTASYPTQPV